MADSGSSKHPSSASMEDLAAQLATMATNDEKLAAISSHLTHVTPEVTKRLELRSGTNQTTSGRLSTSSPSPARANIGVKHVDRDAKLDVAALGQAISQGGRGFASDALSWLQGASGGGVFQRHALERPPCANSDPSKAWQCTNTANLRACGNCNLVLYCSKVRFHAYSPFGSPAHYIWLRNASASIGKHISKVQSAIYLLLAVVI
jgi:hypothetical protein